MEYARFIATTVKNDGLKPVDRDGVAAIAEYGSRLVESKDKMTLKFNDICNIIIEANQCAVEDGSKFISRKHIKTAVEEREYRNRLIADKIFEEILENDIMIDTDGVKIGTINGLAVYSYGDMIFGKPSRITATTFQGKAGIINVEREARLSGNIYNKAVLIISGYLGAHYAQEKPLSLSVSLCFEQSYSSIDGDSASAAELLAILSSIADIPIKQGIAVTGSVNQSGEIQPIGGVNFKVEGFFRLCKDRGFNGKQGVIIPVQNVKNLMLSTEVIEAVKEKKFHIYPVATIDEGIEVLTGVRAGKKGKNGKFPADSVHGKAMAKLLKFSEKSEEEKSKKKK
jgi:lon-related putative ATP-dependent protease